ncbi:hypothetical protein ABPG72_015170 [Tetrahymena utriculariae]
MTISKIKIVQPEMNSSIILKYLKEYQQFYSQVFTKYTLEALQEELESKLLKFNSQEISNLNFHLNKQKFLQNQCNQNKIVQSASSEYKGQDFQNLSENQITSPANIKQFGIDYKNECIYKIQEENSLIATLSEQQIQISPQKRTNYLNLHEFPEQINNIYFSSPREINGQNFRSSQDVLSKENIRDSQVNQEELKNAIPLTSNRKETSRELMSELNLNSQTNITSLKQLYAENQLFRGDAKSYSLKSEQDKTKGIVSLKLINQDNQNEQNQIQLQSTQEITSLKMIENTHQIASQQRFYQDQEIVSYNFLNRNETKETTQKFSLQRQKQINKQRIREYQLENNSPSVSRESTSSTKKILIKTIKKQISLFAIRVVILFGVLTYIALTIATIQQYFNFMDSVDSMNQNLNCQNWPYEVQNVISRSVKNLNIMNSERQNNFTFPTQKDQNTFDDYLLNELQSSQNQFMYLLQTMDFSLSGKMLYDRISDQNSSFYMDHIYNPSNLSQTPSRRTTYNFEQKNSSLLYSIVYINHYIYQQATNPTGKLQEICILQNLPSILFGMKDTQNYFQNYQSEQVKQILNTLNLQIGIILAISAVCLLSTLPLYSYVQKRKDKIIQLFCTFPVNQLQNIIIKITSQILLSSGIVSFGFDMKIYPNSKIVQLRDYIPQIQLMISQTGSLLTNLTMISNQFNLNGRYKQQQFDHFFCPMFEDDMCTLISNNPQYILNTNKFKPEFCKIIYNRFLQKGLKLSIQQFSQRLQEISAIIEIENEKILARAIQEIFKAFNIQDFSNLIDYLDKIINKMNFFLLSNCNEYYQYLKEVQLILIVYQHILITIIFGFCWYAFSSVVAYQITKIKHHLQVMNVYHLQKIISS